MRPHVSPTLLPVSVEPVNETSATSGCSTIAAPILARAVHQLDHFRRQPRLEQDLHEHVPRVRHIFGRLEDHRVSAEERREDLPRRDRQREVERRDDARPRRWAGGSSSPTCCAARSAPCGRTAGALRWRRSTPCRSPPARRPASRRAASPSRASSGRRSLPCARPAGRPRGAARRRARAPACAARARNPSSQTSPRARRRPHHPSGRARSRRACRRDSGSRSTCRWRARPRRRRRNS